MVSSLNVVRRSLHRLSPHLLQLHAGTTVPLPQRPGTPCWRRTEGRAAAIT